MREIKAVIFDIDGVLTDGRKYTDGSISEYKSLCLKDNDAITSLKEKGYILGFITGEDNSFSDYLKTNLQVDFFRTGCKKKIYAIGEFIKEFSVGKEQICYVGDGKYDIEVLSEIGLSVCPADAIGEVKNVAKLILKRKGGEGCLEEILAYLEMEKTAKSKFMSIEKLPAEDEIVRKRIEEHKKVVELLAEEAETLRTINKVGTLITNMYKQGGKVFFCGNGGSAADAQHLAAELVGRFYLERKALNAEALSANISILTSLANDYDYSMVYSRQIEAKGKKGDVIIGISTSGNSKNVILAFEKSKKLGMDTVLLTGNISKESEILAYTDYLFRIPSVDTPRIQEMHILIGHILCEIIEKKLFSYK